MQEIITYLIVAAASTVAVYKLYKSIFDKKKSSSAGCSNCGCAEGSCKTTV